MGFRARSLFWILVFSRRSTRGWRRSASEECDERLREPLGRRGAKARARKRQAVGDERGTTAKAPKNRLCRAELDGLADLYIGAFRRRRPWCLDVLLLGRPGRPAGCPPPPRRAGSPCARRLAHWMSFQAEDRANGPPGGILTRRVPPRHFAGAGAAGDQARRAESDVHPKKASSGLHVQLLWPEVPPAVLVQHPVERSWSSTPPLPPGSRPALRRR